VHDLAGTPLAPEDVFAHLEIRSNNTLLLATTHFVVESGLLQLPLTIPKTLVSGAPEQVELNVDLRHDALEDSFQIELVSAGDVLLRDAGSGALVPLRITPASQVLGRTIVEWPAANAVVQIDSRTPSSTSPSAAAMPIATLMLENRDAAGSAAQRLTDLVLRVVDDVGGSLVPRSVVGAVRVLQGTTVVATAPTIPDAGAAIPIPLPAGLDLAPGASLALAIEADLANPLAHEWIRFAFDPDALRLVDVNDATQTVVPTGTLPFATGLVHVLAAPSQVAFGVAGEPPANVVQGTLGAPLLSLQVRHPGNSNESAITPQRLVVRLRTANGEPLAVATVATAARLAVANATIEASATGDTLVFDLSSLPPLAPRATTDLEMQLDVRVQPDVEDVRFALEPDALAATGSGTPLATIGIDGLTLPWQSASVHLLAAGIETSFSKLSEPVRGRARNDAHHVLSPQAAQVTAEVYTLAGDRVVRLLESESMPAGLHDTLRWDGRNGDGQWVRNGTYLLRLQVDGPQGGKFLRKLAVLR
jgi:predicted secreted protein